MIDTGRNEVVGVIPLAATTPQVIGDATRNRLYILLPSSSEVVMSDGQRIVWRVKLERAPFQMALDERAGRLYVGDGLDGTVGVIDVSSGLVVAHVAPVLRADQSYGPTFMYALAVDTLRNRLLVNSTFFALDQLQTTGSYTITGPPIGDSTWPIFWLANPLLPHYYAISGNGLKLSRMLVVYDSETLKYQDSGVANVSALALDDGAQRLYVSSTLATAITTTENALHVLDESTLNPIAQQSLPARVTAMALNEKTQHLFLAYHGDAVHPTAADDVVEIRDMRTFAQVGTFRVAGEPSAMAFLGDNLYVASSTATDLTVVRDCPEAAPPPPTRTPLPAPSLAPTTTPFPTLTAAPPTPVKPITSWRTYANAMMGYRISYPSTWYLSADNPPNTVFVTSFRMQSSGHGGLPPGSVKIDIGVSPQAEPTVPPPNSQPKRFCVDSRCGTRIELRGSFTDPSAQGLNRLLYIQIPVGKSRYDINAMMADPPADANRNAAIVEQIIASFHFTRP